MRGITSYPFRLWPLFAQLSHPKWLANPTDRMQIHPKKTRKTRFYLHKGAKGKSSAKVFSLLSGAAHEPDFPGTLARRRVIFYVNFCGAGENVRPSLLESA